MAGTIQIKRSANTATPSTLEFGEVPGRIKFI